MPRKGTVLSPEAAEKQKQAIKAWQTENTTKLCFRFRKEKAEAYKELARNRGQSLSSLIQERLDELIKM